ncbi:MAG: hypothetical protein WC069_06850 [Candidatus Shapirobacteria bacterium]
MDYNLLIINTMLIFGLGGLYSLRNMSVSENFNKRGSVIGFATILQKIAPIAIIVFIVFEINRTTWYSPFMYFGISMLISIVLGRLLAYMKLLRPSTEKSEFGILLSSIITSVSIFLLVAYYY